MKKLIISALSLMFATSATHAQSYSLNEGFEGADVPPSGWTTRTSSDASNNKFKWEQVKYSSNPLNLRAGYSQGGENAMMVSSGKKNSAGYIPDSWLISPAVTVSSGDYLSFMMAYAPVYNDLAAVPEEQRIKFAVLVSTTGTDAEDFTETLMEFAPYGETDWRKKVFNLDKFAGKTIYIAFRDYGEATVGSSFTLNRTWIDDVRVGQGASSDFVATELLSPEAGPDTQQSVAFTFTNSGLAPTSITASYKVNDSDPVTETVDVASLTADTVTYNFHTPATLLEGNNIIKVWATADNDLVHENDTLTSKVTIDKKFELPYEMNSDNLSDGWSYSYHTGNLRYGTNTGWWQVPDASYTKNVWGYKKCAKESLLTGKWFKLKKGKINMAINYTTGTDAPLTVSYVSSGPGIKEIINKDFTLSASTDAATQTITLDVVEDGIYKFDFKVGDDYVGPLLVNSIAFEKVAQGDVAVTGVTMPKAVVAEKMNRIYAKVKNYSEDELKNIPVKVDVDGKTVVSDTIASIPSGETIDFEVGQNTTEDESLRGVAFSAGNHEVKVYTAFENDTYIYNDTTTLAVYAYDKPEMPFADSFENTDDAKRWEEEALGNNSLNWNIGTALVGNVNWAKDGENAAYMSSVANTEHNAVLRSPAIHVAEPGKVRLSYYYTTRMKSTNATDLTFITASVKGASDETADFCVSRTDTVADSNVGIYKQGYLLADIPAAGDYLIEFLNTGMGHDVVLDDVRFDQNSDLALVSVSQSAKSGFNNSTDKIIARIANHGTTEKKNFGLTLIKALGSGNESSSMEIFPGIILPGDTVDYAFDDIDISSPDTYTFSVKISDGDDTDEYNNSWTLAAVKSFANAIIPYLADFDTEEQQEQWSFGGTWQTGVYSSSSSAYNGKGAISHHKKAADNSGDWAFSGCIDIPAGTYDLSFFYRTYLHGTTSNLYAQNFALFLGKSPDAKAMTQNIYTSDADVIAADKRYRKVSKTVTVAESGKYYIGVRCNSTTPYGVLYLDNISLNTPATDAAKLDEYTADFSTWHRYDLSDQFAQWTDDEDGSSIVATQKIFNLGNPQIELPGLLVSPAFSLEEGEKIEATLDYSMAAANASDLSAEAKEEMKTYLHVLTADNQNDIDANIACGNVADGTRQTAKGSYTTRKAGTYYFAIGLKGATNCTPDETLLTYHVYGVKLSSITSGITSLNCGDSSGKVDVFSSDGQCLGSFCSINDAMKNCKAKGLYIIKDAASGKSVKMMK